jgi:hypothetical protein
MLCPTNFGSFVPGTDSCTAANDVQSCNNLVDQSRAVAVFRLSRSPAFMGRGEAIG